MSAETLAGRKIGVIVEHKFIPEELEAYRCGFAILGAEVEYISRIFYGDYKPGHQSWKDPVFYSDVDPSDNEAWESPHPLKYTLNEAAKSPDRPLLKDISEAEPAAYAAIIMAANYTSVRLRWHDFDLKNLPPDFDYRKFARSAPVPAFYARAMPQTKVVKGALCHGLWILAPYPELLKDRHVIAHVVVAPDIQNCGAKLTFDPSGVVIDNDLVTGFSKHEVLPFIKAIVQQILALENGSEKT